MRYAPSAPAGRAAVIRVPFFRNTRAPATRISTRGARRGISISYLAPVPVLPTITRLEVEVKPAAPLGARTVTCAPSLSLTRASPPGSAD